MGELVTGAEYEVVYRLPGEGQSVMARAGYLGSGFGGQYFDLRPEAGTMVLQEEWIKNVLEVPRERMKRYAGRKIASLFNRDHSEDDDDEDD